MRDLPFERIPATKPRQLPEPNMSLREFFDWWWSGGPAIQPPMDGTSWIGNGPGVVLFRQGRFQVQLFICRPNTSIPEHTHPRVESFEVHVSGDVDFFVNGQPVHPLEASRQGRKDGTGLSRVWGYRTHVGAGVPHHAEIGPRGGTFISVQRWPEGVCPTSVDEDWEGPPMDGSHLQRLCETSLDENGDQATHYVEGQLCD